MHDLLQFLLALGGVAAAAAVGFMCGVVLLVWLSGSTRSPSETWRPADKS
jgi:hypothetical protein